MLSLKKRLVGLPALGVFGLLTAISCDGDDGRRLVGSSPPYDLTFSLDATFQEPHGGDPVEIAVVRSSDGMVLEQGNGTISSTQDPTFSFTAIDAMERGSGYEIHYWIDSNIGGGTLGVCDPEDIDHQWSFEIPEATNDVAFTTSHQPWLTEDVCATFP